jgi:hypothetical protein
MHLSAMTSWPSQPPAERWLQWPLLPLTDEGFGIGLAGLHGVDE